MKTVWEIYNNIEKDFKKRLASSPEAVDAINELNDEELKRFRSRVFDHYLSLPENQLVLEEEVNIPSKPIYGFGGAKVDTPAVYRPAKTRRVEFSEIEPFVLGQKPQGFWSRVGDDLSNVGKAWKAGNFYSKGGWNDIAQNIINGGTPEEREVLFKNYLDWESKNQMPENKSWVGDVVNGIANLVPLTVDMLPEAATVGAATAAGGAALGSVVPGAGTVAGGVGGFGLGFNASMAEQSYKVGVADIYTSLRKDGVDDETAREKALKWGALYGALEYTGKAIAPIQRKILGGKILKEVIDKTVDKNVKNKIAAAAAKHGIDVLTTGTLESAIEGGQGGITELARQGAKGEGYDVGKVASATWDEAAQAAPAMFGMAALGVPLEAATNFKTKRLQKDLENVQKAVEEGRKVIEVPAGVKLGEVFTGSDGKAYKNVDGIAQPYVVKIKPEVSDTDNLDADAESDPYEKTETQPVIRMGKDGRLYAQTDNTIEQVNADFSPENAAKYYQPFNARGELFDAPIQSMAEDRIYAAEKAEAQKQAQQQQAMIEAQAELEMGRQRLQKKLAELNRKKNRVSAIAKKIAKIDNPDDRLQAMDFYIDVENGDASKLTEDQLYEASSHGFEWADAELSRRAQAENSGVPLLDIMRQDGIKLPTPQAIQRHADANGRGLGSYLYGEIRDLYYSLPKNLQLKYFTKNFVDLDTVAADMEQTHGLHYDSEGDFLADVAANLSGQKVSYGAFSLAEKDYAKMTDAELVEAHRKAETAKDYSAGFEIKKEWDKRRGYNTDVYHGTGADGFNVAKADASEAKNGEGAQAHGMGLYASGNKEVANAYKETAVYSKPYYSYWAKGEELSKGAKELGIRDVYFNDAMSKIADVGFARIKKDLEKEINSYAKEIEELDRRIAHWKEKARRSRTKYYDYMGYVESYSYDARKKEEYKQEAEGKLKLYQLVNDWLASKGISEKELEKRARSDGKLYNWRTNLTKENTLDEQLPFSKQSREVQEKIKNAIESLTEEQLGGVSKEDALRDFIENNTDGGNIYDAFENYTGSKKNASKHLLKHGIRGITYDGKRDGRCYVSFEGGSAVKLQNAFTYDDNGKYIPLDKRSDAGNPDMRYSIGETDAQRFKNELQDYIDGKLDNRHVFKLGTTPEVMRLVGADDLPVELSASVLERKESKHSLILENLSNLPEELADPIAVMQSSTIPDAITLITELPTIDRHNMLVAVHLNKRFGKAEINSIRSIYPKTQSGLQTAIDRGELRYINTKRKPSWITLPFQHASGRKAIQRAYGHEVFTQADLSQAEKENIFKLRGEDKRHSYSISEKERAKQAKIDGIKAAVEGVRAKFNRRAKVKASVDIVGTLEEAREKFGAESIPYNARAVQDKERVVIIAENIDNADEAVRIFLHELVGHWGVKKLFGTKADLKPFLNYIITHYQDSNAWKRVAKYYKDVTKNKYAIAEEVLAHVAENRELSDPSMWKRLVHRVKRELWGNGVPQEYVNLLNEDVLRSAIALSREWAKGDHYLNANGIWAKIDSAPKGRDVPDEPDDGKRFSLIGEKGVSRLKNGWARDLLNEAVEMEKSGVDADKIWQETGWERNTVDGKWRFEIPYGFLKRDPRFKSPTSGVNAFEFPTEQTYSPTRKYKLSDIWNAPILFEAYPELADMRVKFNANPRSLTRGSASKEDGLTINLKDTDLLFGNPIWVKESDIKRTIQHEIEHAIQDIEGFSEGATPYTMRRISAFYNNPEGYRKAKEEIAAAEKPYTDFCLSLGWDGKGRMPKAFKEKLANDRTLANKYMTLVNAYNTTYRNASKYYTMPSEKFGYEQYRRVGGEVEARNAARRLEMTDDERKAKRPSLTADVEPSSQIYLGDSNIDSLNFHDFKTGEKYNAAETRFSIREDSDAEKIDRQFGELYERYKNGDKAAYEEAAKMVADYAESKGYDVKVYHGTGADGFNVADATTRNQKFGEGNQAHGKGLYIAMTPETAERYRRAGRKTESIVVGGKNPEEFGITPENIGINAGRIGDLLRRMYPHGSEFLLSDIKELIARQKDVLARYKARLENLRPPDTKGSLEMGIRMSESLLVSYEKEYAAAKKIDSILKKHNVSVEMRRGRGKVFEWFTNLKPSEVIDEGKTLSKQPDVLKKLEEIWDKVLYPVVDEELKNGSSDAAYVQHYKPTGYLLGEAVIDGWSNYLGKTSFNDLMLEHGIRGITYDGHIDGRCYVSFEGGSTVKLQDPFTFDDNGELIPLSERFDEGNPDMRYSLKEEDEAGARAIRKELPNFIQSMMEIKEGLDENWASFVGKEFSADLIKKIVSFNIDKNQPTNLYEYNEKERNSSRSSQPSPTGEGIVPDKSRRDIRGSVGAFQQGMGQEASDTLLEEFRRLSRAQERVGEEQKIATRADAIKWIRKNVAQGAFFKNHPNLHIEDLFEYKAGSKFSGSKTVEALLEDSEQYGALSVFDRIRIAAVLQRRELKNEYKPVFGGKESLENDKTGGVFVPKNEKVAESQILAADTIRGCDNDCYDCYANKLSKISTINFTHKVPMTLDNIKIKEGQVIRLGTSGDPASNWTHSRNEMIKLFERAWKGSARVKPQDVSFEKNSFVITKLQSIQGYDPKVFPNLEVSLDPFYPEDMFLAMKNLTVLMAMCPDVNVVARIRSYNSLNEYLSQSLDSALQFCKDHNLRVLETRMRFESKTAYSLLGLVEDDYKNKMSASGEKELAQVVGKVRFLPNFYTEEEKSRLLFCGENGELGCGACQNCVNTQVYNREQSGRNSPIIAQSLDEKQNDAYAGISDSDMPMYSLKEGTPENDKEYRQKRAREEIRSKAGRAVQAAVDAFAPLATLERVLYGDVRGAEKSAWKMALMTRNLDQVMFHVLRVGGIKYNKADGSFVKREGTKGLEEILKPVKGENYKNFEHYAKAKSAIERWGFLRKTNFFAGTDFYKTFGFSLEDAKKWVAEGSEASKKAFGELQIFFQGQRDFMLETGLISPEQHAALSRFKNYVPFFREGADLDAETEAAYERFSEIFPAGKGFSGRNSGVEKFEGSARRTKNLVENIVNQSRKVMDSGYKNIAAYRSLNLMRELDMAKYVRSDSVDAQVKIAEMRRALEAEGIEVGDISDEELLKKVPVEAYLKITDDSNDNIVSVRVNGTLRFYKVEDPELLVAVKNFGAEKVNVMWKLLTAPKNIMTQAITKTPEFAIRNFIRDTGSNTILFGGKTIAPYLAHTAKNAVKSAWNTADMQKVWAAGAGGGAWYSVKAEDIAADFKDGGKIQKIGKYTIKPLKWLLNEYERRILMPSEQGNRISVMQKALENGASDMEAAFQYLDVMNFGMHGSGVWTGKNEWAKGTFTALHAVIRITPFLNARIQGLYKLWRESGAQGAKFNAGEEFALKERTRAFVQSLSKAVLLRGMMMASASMLYSLYANSSTDDDGDKWFEKLPAHDKLNYWHFYLGNNNILRIPKPFEIGYIFGTIPEAITDALIQKRPQTAKVLWEGLTSQLEFDPLSNPVIDTVREQYWNKDSFTKRPIIQQSDKDLKPRYQYDPDTSATAKAVARVFEGVGLDDSWLASPARIQNVIGNFLGGMTKYITAASDVIVEALTDIEGGTSRYARESATKRVYDWAVRNTKTMSTRNAEDYYELRNRVREIYGAVRVLRQEKRIDECQDLIDGHKGELGNYNLIEAVNTRLSEISRKRKALGADRTLSTEELIRADDELLAERNQLLADVDILIDRVEKGDFNARDMRDILKRIRNADREKRDSKKARVRLRELANMR